MVCALRLVARGAHTAEGLRLRRPGPSNLPIYAWAGSTLISISQSVSEYAWVQSCDLDQYFVPAHCLVGVLICQIHIAVCIYIVIIIWRKIYIYIYIYWFGVDQSD